MTVDRRRRSNVATGLDSLTHDLPSSPTAALLQLSGEKRSSVRVLAVLPLFRLLFALLLFISASATTIDPTTTGRTRISKETPPQRHMKRLYDDLFAGYEKDIRPVLNDSIPLTVTIQFWLKQILKVDEQDQTIKTYLWLELYWTDELLKWNPADYGGLDQIHIPTHKIWKPDILI